MQESVKEICRDMIKKISSLLDDVSFDSLRIFIDSYPAQVSLLGLQILWTQDSEFALERSKIDKRAMNEIDAKFKNILRFLVDLTTLNLSPTERTRLETLITIHIHQVEFFSFSLLSFSTFSPLVDIFLFADSFPLIPYRFGCFYWLCSCLFESWMWSCRWISLLLSWNNEFVEKMTLSGWNRPDFTGT